GVSNDHAGLLISDIKILDRVPTEPIGSGLGIIFQFDPRRVRAVKALRGVSAAVFGEFLEYVKLDREVRDRYLSEARSSGLFDFKGGAYSIEELWIQSRIRQIVSRAA
ncbi:MAG: hypothetical protein NC930_07170, partial [Candidatus Omnitrophica bacterium]|nr:hypothetical protein [Candidatus Omnitrophota bacterium]